MGGDQARTYGAYKTYTSYRSHSDASSPAIRMAVNLPPQYHDAEAEYKRARTPEEKLAALKKMWVILPKHKASEKVQAILKTKISEVTDAIEAVRAGPKKATASYKIPRQGAGT